MPLPADGSKVKLGKGSLLLDTLTNAGAKTGFDFVGNVTALAISAEVTKAQLFSSTQRSSPLIAEAITRIAYTLNATLSEFQLNNLKKFFLGEDTSRNQIVGVNVTATFTGEEVVAGRYLDTGSLRITDVTVTADTTNILVEDTDYTVLGEFGLIHILKGGQVTDGMEVVVTFDRPALTIDGVRIAKNSSVVCHLLYMADDANNDADPARDRLEVWRVNVAPEGELNLISDEFGSFQLTMAVLDDSVNHPNDPFGKLERIRE